MMKSLQSLKESLIYVHSLCVLESELIQACSDLLLDISLSVDQL